MVGLAAAKALADNHFNVAIVESNTNKPHWDPASTDLRVSAITRASQTILASLGAWQKIESMRTSPFRDMHVWDSTGNGSIHFDSAEIGESCLGHIIENSVIQTALYDACQRQDNIHWHWPASPETLSVDNHCARLTLSDKTLLEAPLIVGADGGNSWVRNVTGIKIKTHDYHQTAIVATVKTERSHEETAWQRFLPTGPLAFLPLSVNQCSIVWSTTPQHADHLLAMDDDAFCRELAKSFDHRLGYIIETSSRRKFPLRSQHAEHYVKQRLALIGDAAHTIHPLAGQGVNLGFADAASLAEIIIATQKKKRDIGSLLSLRPYERWRRGENLAMLTVMTGFKNLFGNEIPAVKTIRNLGLNITDSLTPLKNLIVRHAMGLAGDLPELARNRVS